MKKEDWKDHCEAYYLYEKIVDIFVGQDYRIAMLALSKARNNLMLSTCEEEDLYNELMKFDNWFNDKHKEITCVDQK